MPRFPLPVLMLVTGLLLIAIAAPASAAPRQVSGGTVDWGFANRWRCYVVGFISQGDIETGGGVGRVPGTEATGTLCPLAGANSRAMRFPVTGGTWDADTGELEVRLGGTVRFWGHRSGGKPTLDTTFSDLKVVGSGTSGRILADVSGSTQENPEPVNRDDVPIVTVDLTGAGPGSPNQLQWNAAPTSLTAQGAELFGAYPEGEPFDPVSGTVDLGDLVPEEPPQVEGPPAKVKPAARRQRLKANRLVKLGTARCPKVLACVVKAPKRVGFRVGGKRFVAQVLVPRRIAKGRTARLAVRVPKAAARRLKGRTATVRMRVRIESNGTWTRRTLKVVVRRPAKAGRKR